MGYTASHIPSYASKIVRKAYLESPTGGTRLGFDDAVTDENKSPEMTNFVLRKGILGVRDGQSPIFDDFVLSGLFYSITKEPFCEKTIIHSGTKLYCVESTEVLPSEIYSEMPDRQSVFVEFASKLYIYCDSEIFSVDKEMTVSRELAYAPLLYTSIAPASPDLRTRTDNDLNLASPRIAVSYAQASIRGYLFPFACDVSRPVFVYNDGVEIDPSLYTVSEDRVLFATSPTVAKANDIKVEYYVKTPSDIGFEEKIADCKIGVSYGGTVVSGTRIFLTGNESYAGQYFISELLDPLRFDESSFETIGNGSENITAMLRQYGYLYVFTTRSVSRMSYSFSDGEAVFSVKEINASLGCDVPKSVQLIDNRVVFAHSKRGIFIIDSTEDFGEQNIKPISGNINTGSPLALLCQDSEAIKAAFSIDFDRKYQLVVGEKMYVWDYDAVSFSDSGNYEKAQSRLYWYIFDGIKSSCLFELCSSLLSCGTGKGSGFAVFENTGEDFGEKIASTFTSGSMDFGVPYLRKTVCAFELSSAESASDIELSFFGDGEEYYSANGKISQYFENGRLKLALPPKKISRFCFKIVCRGKINLRGICIDYRIFN